MENENDNSGLIVLAGIVLLPAVISLGYVNFFLIFYVPLALWCMAEWWHLSLKKKTRQDNLILCLGIVYIIIGFYGLLVFSQEISVAWLLGLFLCVAIADAGEFIGKKISNSPKIIEEAMPDKTWASFLFAVGTAELFSLSYLVYLDSHRE